MLRRIGSAVVLAGALAVGAIAFIPPTERARADSCDLHYVAGGDDIPAGNDASTSDAYPTQLLNDHLKKSPGTWCLYGSPQNGTTSSDYISKGQMASANNQAPDLITLSVGEQNSGIEDVIDSCFSDVQSHDFSGAASCAEGITGNSSTFDSLKKDITTILNTYKTIMAGRPELVVAVVGYPNPYPSSDSAEENVPQLCDPLVDTESTCEERWQQLPPALEALSSVFKQLNSTLASAVQPFADGYGGRFMFVDPTSQFSDHCMTMDVAIQTQVSHGDDVEEEDSSQSFGCDSSWWSTHGDGNFDPPTYLEPAESGVLVGEEQETTGMGIYPNSDGQKCIADLVWEAVKIKLGTPQTPASDVCSGGSVSQSSNVTENPSGTGKGEASAGGVSAPARRGRARARARHASRHRMRACSAHPRHARHSRARCVARHGTSRRHNRRRHTRRG